MASILTRTHRATFMLAFGLIGLSLFSPMVAFANADLESGDQGTVTGDASLRSEPSYDATVVVILTDGASVSILEGPITGNDGSLWYSITALDNAGYLPAGAITSPATADIPDEETDDSSTLPDLTTDDAAPGTPDVEDTAVSIAPEGDVVDFGVVVDNSVDPLPADGLACRAEAAVSARIVNRAAQGTTLEITGDRLTIEGTSFYPVNCLGQGGFVKADYVVLASAETAPDSTAGTEDIAAETVDPTAVVETTEPTVSVEDIAAGTATDEDEALALEASPAIGVEPTTVVEEVATEATVVQTIEPTTTVEEVATEEAAVQTPEPTAAVEELATEATVVETIEPTAVVEELATEEVAEPTAAAEEVAEPTAAAEEVVTEEVAVQAAEPTTAIAVEDVATSQESVTSVFDDSRTAGSTPAATARAGVTASSRQRQGAAPDSARTSTAQTSLDASRSIGSAEVQGTNGVGLRCRTAPNTTSPTITVLAESSFVLVHAEPRDGYLGVVCAGQAGWADVDYLWSGGAEEISSGAFTTAAGGGTISGTNGDGVRCRRGPSTSDAVIAIVPEGTRVATRGPASGGWVPINCYGYSGFVSASFITIDGGGPAPTPAPTSSSGTVQVTGTGGGLRCRSAASLSGGIITILPDGTSIAVRGSASGGWLPVVCAGQNGFVSTQFVSGGSAPSPTPTSPPPGGGSSTVIGWGNISGTSGQGVRCRSAASTTASVITVIPEGTQVGLRGAASGGWMPVNCYGYSGFVSAMYVYVGSGSSPAPAPTPPAPPSGLMAGDNAKTSSNVNLRYSASTGAGIAAVVPAGTVVRITGSGTSNFYPVDWDGLRGFVSADYLVKTSEALSKRGGSAAPAPAPPTTGDGTNATGNAMVDFALRYKGYPYRWANHGPSAFDCSGFTYWVTLNVTGKDIGYGLWTQANAGTPVSRANIQPGDLVFFQNTYKAGLSHSGVYIGNNQFIHAENETTGVRISDLNSTYYGSRWYGAVRMT